VTELLTAVEVVQQLRVEESTVRRWAKSGAMTCVRLPGQGRRGYRFSAAVVEQILAPVQASK